MAKKLYRSRKNKRIAGVCGGLGDYFNIDPIFFRLTFLMIFFIGGVGVLIYLIMWSWTPLEPESKES